jgi:PadR family transcriptional regulator, regulatory protein PadR
MRAESLKGHLDLLLLGVLRDQPAHGYRVIELLRERSAGAFDLPEGTVYPALHRLERAGLLASTWNQQAPRRRRVYTLTPAGTAALDERRGEWRRFAGAMRAVVGA